MSDRAKKVSELTVTASVANGDLFIIGKVAANTTNTVTGNTLATYVSSKNFPNSTKANNATGTAGQLSWDASYIYVCVATNTWKRVALETY